MTAPDISRRTFALTLTLYGAAALLAASIFAASGAAFAWPVAVAWLGGRS